MKKALLVTGVSAAASSQTLFVTSSVDITDPELCRLCLARHVKGCCSLHAPENKHCQRVSCTRSGLQLTRGNSAVQCTHTSAHFCLRATHVFMRIAFSQLIFLCTYKRLEICVADTSPIIVGWKVGLNSTDLCQGLLTLFHVMKHMCGHQEWVVTLDLAVS